ncbi:MAG: DUF2501 domain-containing protein [Rhodospirillales bacterium]|nr:DUF2501 domain-containing protein [Rhodospirillales bacterium]
MPMRQHGRIFAPARRIGVGFATVGFAASLLLAGAPARAQLFNQLENSLGSGQGVAGALGGLGGGLPSVDQASPLNLAGVLQYCVENSLLSGGSAASVRNSLLSKVTGSGGATTDSQYSAGASGLLQTGQGQNFNLGGGGLMADLKQKVCDLVLQHAQSLL